MCLASLAIMSEVVPSHHFGKASGFINIAASLGTSSGPVVSGLVFEKFGYWAAWSCAFGILAIDVILRILMLGTPTIPTGALLILRLILYPCGRRLLYSMGHF